MATPERALQNARDVIRASRYVFFMTGSGISAESGVPTFRGEGGYWRNRSFMELATLEAFNADPRLIWDWYLERRATCLACEPNAAHRAMADWARANPCTLVTQNVDGLHERAGHEGVVRFHGSLWQNKCTVCGNERAAKELRYLDLPRSACCGALERPGVVWFGEAIPHASLTQALEALELADVMFVVGTSGVVQPAAGLADAARNRGASVIVVNPESTPVEATIVLPLPASEAVPLVLEAVATD